MSKTHLRQKPKAVNPAPATPTTEEPQIAVAVATPISAAANEPEDDVELAVVPGTPPTSELDEDNDDDVDLSDLEDGDDDADAASDVLLVDNDDEVLLEPAKPAKVAKDEEQGFLQIFSENCLSCKALVPTMKKTFKACHFSKGNSACPAKLVQIVYRVPLEEIVPKFLAAEKEADYNRLAKLAAHLATKPDWYQLRVKDAIAEARANQQ